ncbi:hypothetical protein NHI66_003162 [Clostridium botulinum]|nr:hypothetical protein [Clostridium botulinum]
MNEEVKELISFHGTSRKNAKLIKEDGFRMSPAGWLGEGIYFFHNNSDLARKWANKNFSNQRTEVIKRNIKVGNGKIFDMVNPEGEHNQLFHNLRADLVKQSEANGIKCNFNREDLEEKIRKIESQVIKKICENGDFHIVRAATFTKFFSINECSVTPNGVEICVKRESYVNMR